MYLQLENQNNRKKKITNPIIHDFVASLFLFDEICTSQVFKMKIFTEVKEFVDGRLIKNKEFFNFDNVFTTIYDFIRNVVDYLYEKKRIMTSVGKNILFYVARRLRWTTFLYKIERRNSSLYKMDEPIRIRVS